MLLFLPAAALADDPAGCPALPAEYAGSDLVVSELRSARVDERTACLAITSRQDLARDDAAAAAAAAHDVAERAHTDSTDTQTAVGEVKAAVQALPTPAPAAESSPYDGPTPAQVDDAARALHGDLWLLLGAGAALVFGVPFLRIVNPFGR